MVIAPLTAFAAAPTQAVIVMTKPSNHFAAKSLSAMFLFCSDTRPATR